MKPWYKSKTVIFNILATLVPIAGYVATSDAVLQQFLSPTKFAIYSTAIGMVNVVLRAITTQGVSFFQEDSSEKTA
jgi:hypothetical protein